MASMEILIAVITNQWGTKFMGTGLSGCRLVLLLISITKIETQNSPETANIKRPPSSA